MEIQQLQSDVIDKIAAGEVVERPSHLLKELLENSIDAGATEIEIEVDNGGKNLKVLDNGKGVLSEELPLVFARHATSKIRQSEDLWQLSTFGFRGEALASISSVSRLKFTSRRRDADKAYSIACDFGEVGETFETSMQEGTQVEVNDLFENIPARLKFLKSDSAEVTQIKNVIKAMALQYPDVQIRFKSKGQLVFFWPSGDSLLERVEKVLDCKKLYEATYEYEGFKSHVIFSDPSNVVRVSRQIWTFVQNRWVQDRSLQAAVMEAYRSLLMHGQYPICFVSVTCPPDEVDVNIHPTKSQVKFVDAKKAFRVVHYALREAIEKAPWRQAMVSPTATLQPQPPVVESSMEFKAADFSRTQFKQKTSLSAPNPKISDLQTANELPIKEPLEVFSEAVEAPAEAEAFWSQMQVIGQVDLTYIVAQTDDKMILIDQHAAHERVAFERLMKSWKQGSMEVQNMLLPLTVDMEEAEVEALLTLQEDLQTMGIMIEQEGPASLAISSLPPLIKEKAIVEALQKLAREFMEKGGSFAIENAVAAVFETMACHSVIRAGQALSHEEMKQLLRDMDAYPLSGFCPHGRSVHIEFPFVSLEKDFGRRV